MGDDSRESSSRSDTAGRADRGDADLLLQHEDVRAIGGARLSLVTPTEEVDDSPVTLVEQHEDSRESDGGIGATGAGSMAGAEQQPPT